jgi:hypothetical protein
MDVAETDAGLPTRPPLRSLSITVNQSMYLQRRSTMAKRTGLAQAALKGAVASAVGGMAIKMVWEAGQRALVPEEKRVHSPTAEVVQTLATRTGAGLTQAQVRAVAGAFYGGTMLTYGALYGMVQSRLHPPTLAHGFLLGAIMYAANFPRFGILPRLGVLPAPQEQPMQEAAIPFIAQAAYAMTTASVYKALNRA